MIMEETEEEDESDSPENESETEQENLTQSKPDKVEDNEEPRY